MNAVPGETMRAVAVSRFGGEPEVVELPRPEPGPRELLVRILAAGVNPFDWKVVDGILDGAMPHVFPLVLGNDGAGVVEALGPDAAGFVQGEQLFGQFLHAPVGAGTFAEYATVPADNPLAALPVGVSAVQAAALPTAGMTALQLVAAADLRPGAVVLVVGATGGVGSFAVQLAAARGAIVIATGRPESADWVRELGATEVVDHGAGQVTDHVLLGHVHGVDALLDLVSGPEAFAAGLAAVQSGGVALTTTFAADPALLAARGLRGGNFTMRGSAADLRLLAGEVAAGRLRVRIGREVGLADVPEVIAASRAGRLRGKAVVRIAD